MAKTRARSTSSQASGSCSDLPAPVRPFEPAPLRASSPGQDRTQCVEPRAHELEECVDPSETAGVEFAEQTSDAGQVGHRMKGLHEVRFAISQRQRLDRNTDARPCAGRRTMHAWTIGYRGSHQERVLLLCWRPGIPVRDSGRRSELGTSRSLQTTAPAKNCGSKMTASCADTRLSRDNTTLILSLAFYVQREAETLLTPQEALARPLSEWRLHP